ncbi:MAG: 50S ribosomal protein L34 [bacterium]|nr:50S ribosomal protein L34 [bacterium]
MSTTYKPKKRKRAKTHGFLSRQRTSTGRRTIRNRRRKGRTRLSTSKS